MKRGHSRGSKKVANVKIKSKPVPQPIVPSKRTVDESDGESDTEAVGDATNSSPEKERRPLQGAVLCSTGLSGTAKVREGSCALSVEPSDNASQVRHPSQGCDTWRNLAAFTDRRRYPSHFGDHSE
jgi:hypothetical protein